MFVHYDWSEMGLDVELSVLESYWSTQVALLQFWCQKWLWEPSDKRSDEDEMNPERSISCEISNQVYKHLSLCVEFGFCVIIVNFLVHQWT